MISDKCASVAISNSHQVFVGFLYVRRRRRATCDGPANLVHNVVHGGTSPNESVALQWWCGQIKQLVLQHR